MQPGKTDADPYPDTGFDQRYRPQFHFTPTRNWTNDPNGCVYYDGEYHLFFQHNPEGVQWGNMTWGHAVSIDLVHWKQIAHAILPDELGTIFSGSAAIDWKNTSGFQDGDVPPMVAAFTYAGTHAEPKRPFTQAIAYSTDRGRTFTKYAGNPVIPNVSGGSDRDPKILWHEPTQKWVMVLYLTDGGKRLGFFTSEDLKTWTQVSEVADFHECPDLFELALDGDATNSKWILLGADARYLIGHFDGAKFTTQGGKHVGDHGGSFYASQSYNDVPAEDGRRIQIAWMAHGASYPGMPFNQQMSFPCELILRSTKNGPRVCRMPVREIESLYDKMHEIKNVALPSGANPLSEIRGDLFDIDLEIDVGRSAECGIRFHRKDVSFNGKGVSCLGKTAPLAPVDGIIRLRILIDRTSVEVFGNDGLVSMSSCFVPENLETGLELYATGGEAKVVKGVVRQLRSACPTAG